MSRVFRFFIVLAIALMQNLGFAQTLTLTFTDIGKTQTLKIPKVQCDDSITIQKRLNDCLVPFFRAGYIAASIDTFTCEFPNFKAKGIRGPQYHWVKVQLDSLSIGILNNNGIELVKESGRPLNPALFVRYINSVLNQLENSGYPFARIKLNTVEITENTISTLIKVEKGPMISIDTIYLKGDVRISNSKLFAILNYKRGETYNEFKIRKIDQRINNQGYIRIIRPSEVEFLNHKARIYCYLTNKSASRFWGLVGFHNDETDGKIKLNGDINLSLKNSLRFGETLNFIWNAPGKGTQMLNVETDWPYILSSQVGVSSKFILYKHDSTYLSVNPKFSFNFYTPIGGRFLINIDFKKTTFTSIPQAQTLQYANSTAVLYGVGYEFSSLNNIVLPSHGFYLLGSVNTGNRKEDHQTSSTSNLFETDLFINGFIPINQSNLILALGSRSKIRKVYKSNGNPKLYENELYRLGGMGTIRGFNQESILSSAYSILSTELHLRVTDGSGFFLFADKGFIKAYELGQGKDAWPLGIGMGLNLSTKAGIFNLSYALGQGFGQRLGLNDAKIHFGIMATF